jgi:hypothetical protein
MILDGLLMFTGTSNGAAAGITSGANTDAPTTGTQVASNILDLGVKLGIPAYAQGGGARDLGIGDDPAMKLLVQVTTTFVYGAGGGTTIVDLAGAPDSGTGTEGSYTVMWTSFTFLQATMIAGAQLGNVDLPRTIAGQVVPRFLRLRFITATATYTAGQIEACIVLDRFDQIGSMTGILSGYPAGINVAN